MKILVSVIIPIYNSEKYISRCIESILNQSLQNFELILINDASLDSTYDIICGYQKKDCRIKIINNDINHGPMISRKNGYSVARGKYITFCDADDFLSESALEIMCSKIENVNADIVVCDFIRLLQNGRKIRLWNKLSFGNDKISVFKSLLTNELKPSLCGKVYSTRLFTNLLSTFDGFDRGEDALLFYQLVNKSENIVLINEPVYFYFQNLESTTSKGYSYKNLDDFLFIDNFIMNLFVENKELKKMMTVKIMESLLYFLMYDISIRKAIDQYPNIKILLDKKTIFHSLGLTRGLYFIILKNFKCCRFFIKKMLEIRCFAVKLVNKLKHG